MHFLVLGQIRKITLTQKILIQPPTSTDLTSPHLVQPQNRAIRTPLPPYPSRIRGLGSIYIVRPNPCQKHNNFDAKSRKKSIISLSTYQPDLDHGYGMYLTEKPIFEGVPELGFDRQGYHCTLGT